MSWQNTRIRIRCSIHACYMYCCRIRSKYGCDNGSKHCNKELRIITRRGSGWRSGPSRLEVGQLASSDGLYYWRLRKVSHNLISSFCCTYAGTIRTFLLPSPHVFQTTNTSYVFLMTSELGKQRIFYPKLPKK